MSQHFKNLPKIDAAILTKIDNQENYFNILNSPDSNGRKCFKYDMQRKSISSTPGKMYIVNWNSSAIEKPNMAKSQQSNLTSNRHEFVVNQETNDATPQEGQSEAMDTSCNPPHNLQLTESDQALALNFKQ